MTECTDYHGIDPDRWTVVPHPLTACAELTEMGKGPTPSFLDALMSTEGRAKAYWS